MSETGKSRDHIKCPKCGKRLHLPEIKQAQHIRCPACNHVFTVSPRSQPQPLAGEYTGEGTGSFTKAALATLAALGIALIAVLLYRTGVGPSAPKEAPRPTPIAARDTKPKPQTDNLEVAHEGPATKPAPKPGPAVKPPPKMLSDTDARRKKLAADLLAEGKKSLDNNQAEKAVQYLDRAVQLDPTNAQAKRLLVLARKMSAATGHLVRIRSVAKGEALVEFEKAMKRSGELLVSADATTEFNDAAQAAQAADNILTTAKRLFDDADYRRLKARVRAQIKWVDLRRDQWDRRRAPAESELDRQVRKRLETEIPKLDFDDIELKDVIQFLRDVSAANIYVKWKALGFDGIDKSTTVNIHLTNVTLKKALETILDDVAGGEAATGLAYVIDEGVITISTKSDLKPRKHADAIAALKKVVAIKPHDFMAYFNMGVAYHKLGKYPEAIAAYKKSIAIKPDDPLAYYNMGVAYDCLRKYAEGIAAFKKAIALKPDYAEAYFNMGYAYKELKRYTDAIRAYNKALANKPDLAEAYVNIGYAYAHLRQDAEAIAAYRQYLRLKPTGELADWVRKTIRELERN